MAKFLDYHGLSKLVEKIKNTYVNKNEQYEANLKWGGRNFAASYGPIDAAMISELGANRFAFGYPRGITVEYSNDGGSTWHDYGASDEQKLRLTTTGSGFTIGKVKSSTPENDMLRITFDTSDDNGINCYSDLNKFVIKISTLGSSGCYCKIQKATQANPTTYVDAVTSNGTSVSFIDGWPGYNIINTETIRTYGNQPQHYLKLRFIFGNTGNTTDYQGLTVSRIYAFGGAGFNTPSAMADNGHLYYYDYAQNATFPANVKANAFVGKLDGNAATASKLGTATVGSATKPIYLNGGTPTACTHSIESDVPHNAKFTDTWRPLGNTADTACAGNDSRLSDSRRASDVYAWAKAATKPSYSWGEIKDKPSSFTPVSHNHDDRYYTETEMNSKLDEKVDNTVNGCNALLSKLNTLTGSPIDDEYFIRQDAAGSSTFGRVKFSTLWSYIKNKSDSIYQPTGRYAAASHTHTKNQITDFPSSLKNPTSLTIKGNGSPMAVYDGSEAKIVNITKSSIGLEHVDNTADIDKTVKSAASADKVNGHTVNKDVPSNAVFTDKNVYQVSDNSTTTVLPLLLSPLTEDTKADEVHQTTNAKYNFSIGAVPSEGKIKATIFDGTTFTGNAATATKASQDGDGNTISSTYLKLIGGEMSGTITTVKDSKPAIDFRGQHGSYGATINYDTAGNEALAVNLQQATTSFMVNSGINGKTWTSSGKYSTVTPTLQIKGKCVSINKFIPDNTTPTHTLEVNGSIKATSFDGTASRATYADKYSYNGADRDFVYDAVDGGNHYIRCKDATIIRANGTNLNKYEFIINSDGKGGCYIYDSANKKGTTWSPDGIAFEKAPANSLVAANGTFATAISDTDIKNAINSAIDWTQAL